MIINREGREREEATREIRRHDLGIKDDHGRDVEYESTIEPIYDEETGRPRAWRVWGRNLRDGRAMGRGCTPYHVYSIREARTLANTLALRYKRYVERHPGRKAARASAAEESLMALAEGKR